MKIKNILRTHFVLQGGKCHYCQQPMWLDNLEAFARKYRISNAQARFLQATAEHLKAKCEGGKNSKSNLVAACHFCNSKRHQAKSPLVPEMYLNEVRKRLARGKWHGIKVAPFDVGDLTDGNRSKESMRVG
jgi:hypothetical protein